MSYKIIEMDPRVPFELGPDRAETINRQVDEIVVPMVLSSVFVEKARDLRNEISNRLAEIDKEMAKKDEDDAAKEAKRLERLACDRTYQEARHRTPDQLAEEKRDEIRTVAVKVLGGFHQRKMAGRLAQWKTTCRLDGCEKQPRVANRPATSGRKASRRNHMFCAGHAGVKNLISKADFGQLQDNANFRVVVAE